MKNKFVKNSDRRTLAIIVVLYNNDVDSSLTVQSLLSLNRSGFVPRNCEVILWNNGPIFISFAELPDGWRIINATENYPLSMVYNYFLTSMCSDCVAFFDDDTSLSEKYMSDVTSFVSDSISVPALGLPIVCSRGSLNLERPVYPVSFETGDFGTDFSAGEFRSVGSGLVINRQLADNLKSRYGDVFDERFAFYGVDTSFFARLRGLPNVSTYFFSRIIHDLSRLAPGRDDKYKFRYRERLVDMLLMQLHYGLGKSICYVFPRALLYLGVGAAFYILKVFLLRRHPRVPPCLRLNITFDLRGV